MKLFSCLLLRLVRPSNVKNIFNTGAEKVEIFETILRDGEQVFGCKLERTEKRVIALLLDELGVDIIEVGFPVSSPRGFSSVQAISNLVMLFVL